MKTKTTIPIIKQKRKKGWIDKLLKWLAEGAKKSGREGNSCPT